MDGERESYLNDDLWREQSEEDAYHNREMAAEDARYEREQAEQDKYEKAFERGIVEQETRYEE